MQKRSATVLCATLLTLTGCVSNPASPSGSPAISSPLNGGFVPAALSFNIITPIGAPAMAYTLFAKEAKCTISTTPANVRAALVDPKTTYKAIVFDAVTGLKLLKSQATPAYRLTRMLTTGNLLIVATGQDANRTMEDEDNIVSFGAGGIPDTVFKLIYPSLEPDYYTNGVAQAAAVLTSGLYEGQKVDYVVISEPYYSNLKDRLEDIYIYADLNREYVLHASSLGYEVTGFPQAGLFLAADYHQPSHEEEVASFLKTIDEVMADLSSDARQTIAYLEEHFSRSAQEETFGYDTTVLEAMSREGNRLAFNSSAYDISSFYSLTGSEAPSSDLYSPYYI